MRTAAREQPHGERHGSRNCEPSDAHYAVKTYHFLGANSAKELARLSSLRPKIRMNGAIWVVSRKGKARTIRDVDVIEAALEAGLVDNKVVSFSETQTALRAVIRVRDRPVS